MLQKENCSALVQRILFAASPVRIFLLGTTFAKYETASIFQSDHLVNNFDYHYYVLVLISRNPAINRNNVQDKIETVCQPVTPVTAIVIEVEQFNDWLSQGHPFACFVKAKSMVLFEDKRIDLIDATTTDNPIHDQLKKDAQLQGLNMVNEFLAGADLFRVRKQNKMAAFMLHQAAESALLSILKIAIGLTVNSHNLDKLVRYCALVTPTVANIFNRNAANEKRLFQLLQRAYIETRYRDDYVIKTPDLLEITSKIKKLQELLVSIGS